MKRPVSTGEKVAIAVGLIVAVLLVVFAYWGGRWLEERKSKPEPRGDYRMRADNLPTITHGSLQYRQKNNIVSILLMGIDRDAKAAEQSMRMNGGQADFMQLLVIDHSEKRVYRLPIDRDTMTPITVLGVLGNRSGVRTAQISLSHGFGDGREQSCVLTAEAVSNLLLGVPIDYYIAMNLEGIAALNDLAGGVTVTLEDDYSALDSAMTAGSTLTLTGKQAEIYLRSRMDVGDGTNEARMGRQEYYIEELLRQIEGRQEMDKNFVGTLFDGLGDYLVTSLSRGQLINELWNIREYTRSNPLVLQGEHRVGSDGFMQFYAEEESVYEAVLEMFYEQVS